MTEGPARPRTAPDRWLTRIEDGILSLLLITMVVLSGLQIALRNLFDSGLTWIDPLLRVLVLWLGLVGATVAARRGKHIRIDLINRYLGGLSARLAEAAGNAFTALVCALIAWHGTRMVLDERQFGAEGVLDLPVWVLQLVIPAAFGLIALIYLVTTFTAWLRGRRRRP